MVAVEVHPPVVDWLQVLVAKAVTELEPPLATNTFPSVESSVTASGPEPAGTVATGVTALLGLPLLPSLSTLTLLEDWLATYRVPVEGSATCATGWEPVWSAVTLLTLQPSEPWSPAATKTDWPSAAAAWKRVFSELWYAEGTYASQPFVQLMLTIFAVSSVSIWLTTLYIEAEVPPS